MTKNRKMELLINDNKRLMKENRKLHELGSKELGKKIITEIERYSDVIDKLYGESKKLDSLRVERVMNRWKYRMMIWSLKIRKAFS